jgi:hypothetical protein
MILKTSERIHLSAYTRSIHLTRQDKKKRERVRNRQNLRTQVIFFALKSRISNWEKMQRDTEIKVLEEIYKNTKFQGKKVPY